MLFALRSLALFWSLRAPRSARNTSSFSRLQAKTCTHDSSLGPHAATHRPTGLPHGANSWPRGEGQIEREWNLSCPGPPASMPTSTLPPMGARPLHTCGTPHAPSALLPHGLGAPSACHAGHWQPEERACMKWKEETAGQVQSTTVRISGQLGMVKQMWLKRMG